MAPFLGVSPNELDYLLRDAGEDFRVFGGEGGEDFTVESDAALLQFIDEGAVGLVPIFSNSSIQTDDPELAEVALLIAAMGEGVAAGAHKTFMCLPNLGRAAVAKPFRSLQYICAAFMRAQSSFRSCHKK